MGDVSAEPSMEDILASIKRIISEEDGAPPGGRRDVEGDVSPLAEELTVEALEPGDPYTEQAAETTPHPVSAAPIVSSATAEATRGALDALSRVVVKTDPPSETTLESLVREMIRPMLREWIDAKLPGLVEAMVAREIARISGDRG